MGSLHKPKSTRARRGRSVLASANPPQSPASYSPSSVSAERETQVDSILEAARQFPPGREPLDTQPPGIRSPLTAMLRDLRERLAVVCAVALTAAAALRSQNADNDADVSLTLRHCVGDELARQIDRIDNLIGGVAS